MHTYTHTHTPWMLLTVEFLYATKNGLLEFGVGSRTAQMNVCPSNPPLGTSTLYMGPALNSVRRSSPTQITGRSGLLVSQRKVIRVSVGRTAATGGMIVMAGSKIKREREKN